MWRETLDGIFYVLSTGCQWQALPKDLPPKSTVWGLFRPLELGQHAGAHPSRALCSGTRAGGTGGAPNRLSKKWKSCPKMQVELSLI